MISYKFLFITVFLSAVLTLNSFSQSIIRAGDTLSNYTDITPDTLIQLGGSSASYEVDVNSDGQMDFRIVTYSVYTTTVTGWQAIIESFDNFSFTLDRIDSLYAPIMSNWFTCRVGKVLFKNDTINSAVAKWESNVALYSNMNF